MTALSGIKRLLALCAIAALPAGAYAQEATLSGTVTDSTGGALPGVTITAVHPASGNTFVGTTDERGTYRVPVRTGAFQIAAELSGFATLTRKAELLVGQTIVLAFEMVPAAVQETVNVTGQSPLVDTVSSALGTNVDPRQMQELPLNGRNFVDLTMLAVGSRQNASSDELGGLGTFQLNVDGLRVTQNQTGGFGQPKYSRDAIAELEFVSNRFDASDGGSSGTLVNAITKSGTNIFGGSVSGYFRDDKFIEEDFVAGRVLPYQNQQISTTFGGPIQKDRMHFFANYEYEREPQTFSHSSPYPSFNFDLTGTRMESKGGGRFDLQISPMTRLSIRGNKSLVDMPYDARYTGGASRHPSSAIKTDRHSTDVSGNLTQVFSSHMLNEIRAGYAAYYWIQDSIVSWPNHPYPGLTLGTPIINFRGGYRIGMAHNFSHEDERQSTYSFRDNLTISFDKAGRHDMKLGGEGFYQKNPVFLCIRCQGVLDASGGAIPANIESLFPVWNDISSWNLQALSPIVRSYTLGVGNQQVHAPLMGVSGWVQDDWKIGSRLTVNLGLRYDLEDGVFAEDVELQPWLVGGRKNDTNNFAPRVGGALKFGERTVLRGGAGRYFADPGSHTAYWTLMNAAVLQPQIFYDGRADFASNPFNGPIPTYDQVAATLCTVSTAANCLRRSTTNFAVEGNEIPYSNQASVGIQRQFGSTMAVEADYVYTANRAMLVSLNANLAYDAATGINYPFTDISKRPYSDWADVSVRRTIGESDYHGLQMSFTKRMSDRWQAQATYLLVGQWNLQNAPAAGAGCTNPTTLSAQGPTCAVPVNLHPALAEEWYLSNDQRHRATFNSIWQIGAGFQLSGLYFYGDNGWATPSSGFDFFRDGSTGGRVRANGTIIERNSFDLPSLHRVDMRLQKQFRLTDRATISGMFEIYNVFNHANYGSFVTNESNARFGQPTESVNVSYQPRMLQFGFRTTF